MANIATLDSQLNQLECKLRSIRQTSEELSLELIEKPNNDDVLSALTRLETSEADTVRSIDRLTRARAAAGRKRTADDAHARLDEMRTQADQVNALGQQLEKTSEELLDAIEGLGPLLHKYERLALDRLDLARRVLRSGEAKPGSFARHDAARYGGAASLKEAPTAQAMLAILWRLGFGRTGPDFSGLVEMPGPNLLGAFNEHRDVREVLREQFTRQRELLQAGMARAIQNVEAQ